ncbi:MAG TPA: hypothetical protein VFU11_05240 [Solirubrobacterales bacterium]|nr:hypothetical protein [Solirubrobacterales bacterium]
MLISTTFDLEGVCDKAAVGERIAADIRRSIETKFGGDGNAVGEPPTVDRLNVTVTEVERSRFELAVYTDDLQTDSDADLADRLLEVAGWVREGATKGLITGSFGVVGHYGHVYADDLDSPPAYTVVGVYLVGDDLHQRYATTVHTHDGPEAAEVMAQEVCRRDNRHDSDEDMLEIAAVMPGAVHVVR